MQIISICLLTEIGEMSGAVWRKWVTVEEVDASALSAIDKDRHIIIIQITYAQHLLNIRMYGHLGDSVNTGLSLFMK